MQLLRLKVIVTVFCGKGKTYQALLIVSNQQICTHKILAVGSCSNRKICEICIPRKFYAYGRWTDFHVQCLDTQQMFLYYKAYFILPGGKLWWLPCLVQGNLVSHSIIRSILAYIIVNQYFINYILVA